MVVVEDFVVVVVSVAVLQRQDFGVVLEVVLEVSVHLLKLLVWQVLLLLLLV